MLTTCSDFVNQNQQLHLHKPNLGSLDEVTFVLPVGRQKQYKQHQLLQCDQLNTLNRSLQPDH